MNHRIGSRGPSRPLFVAAALACMLCSSPCRALDRTPTELRLTLSADFVHASGSTLVSARYGGRWGLRAGFWAHTSGVDPAPHAFVGADHVWRYSNWRLGAGAVWIDETNKLNGTRWEFDASLGYDLTPRIFVEYRHHSHGARFGIRKDAPNGGWNLIGVGFVF